MVSMADQHTDGCLQKTIQSDFEVWTIKKANVNFGWHTCTPALGHFFTNGQLPAMPSNLTASHRGRAGLQLATEMADWPPARVPLWLSLKAMASRVLVREGVHPWTNQESWWAAGQGHSGWVGTRDPWGSQQQLQLLPTVSSWHLCEQSQHGRQAQDDRDFTWELDSNLEKALLLPRSFMCLSIKHYYYFQTLCTELVISMQNKYPLNAFKNIMKHECK